MGGIVTPKQRKQLAAILLKEGEEGWTVERLWRGTNEWSSISNSHEVTCDLNSYRAVGPRKRVDLKRGMEVKLYDGSCGIITLDRTTSEHRWKISWTNDEDTYSNGSAVTHYRWPNGDGTWLPIEGEPEIISMEGME